MARLVVAAAPDLVRPGERAFVERLAEPADGMVSYASLLDAADCRTVDEAAYLDARMWYRSSSGNDMSMADGVSLGRAFEYVATTELVRLYRAKLVLERLAADQSMGSVELRGVSHEWAFAARELGIAPHSDNEPSAGPLPGAHPTPPPAYLRASAALPSLLARPPGVAVVDARAWAVPYGRAIAHRWAIEAVEPGPRFVLGMTRSGRLMKTRWLADAPKAAADASFAEHAQHALLGHMYRRFASEMQAAARWGADCAHRYRLAVSCQDVLPPVRAWLLGFRGAGGKVVTLEHGISGSFADQVQSVADVLGVWGEPQRAYHSRLAPVGTSVSVLGWARLEGVRQAENPTPEWDAVYFAQPTQDLACGSWPSDVLRAHSWVDEYASRYPTRRVAIKPHPSSSVYGWGRAGASHARIVAGDSLDLIRSARVAIVSLSTTGVEAMASGTPVVQIRSEGALNGPDFVAASGLTTAESAADLIDAVECLLSDSGERSRAREHGREYAERFVDSLTVPRVAARKLVETLDQLERAN